MSLALLIALLMTCSTSTAWWWSQNNPPGDNSCPAGKNPADTSWQDGWAGCEMIDNHGDEIGGTFDLWGPAQNIPIVQGEICVWSVKYNIKLTLTADPYPVKENKLEVILVLGYYAQWPGGWQFIMQDDDWLTNDMEGTTLQASGFLHVFHPEHQYKVGEIYTLDLMMWGEYYDERWESWEVGVSWVDHNSYEIVA